MRSSVPTALPLPLISLRIFQFGGIDLHGTLRSRRGCLRHNCDADTCLHHATDLVEVTDAGANLHDDAEPCRLTGKMRKHKAELATLGRGRMVEAFCASKSPRKHYPSR